MKERGFGETYEASERRRGQEKERLINAEGREARLHASDFAESRRSQFFQKNTG